VKISIVAGGSLRLPVLVRGFADRAQDLGLSEISVFEPDPRLATAMQRVCTAGPAGAAQGLALTWAPTIRSSLLDTSFVIAAMEVGGDHMRTLDQQVCAAMQVPLYETAGAASFAEAVRTIPAALQLAAALRDTAPEAWLINLTDPPGIIVQAMLTHGAVHTVVGLTETPATVRTALATLLEAHPEDIVLDWYGLSHLGFLKAVSILGRDVLPHVLAMTDGLPELRALTPFSSAFLQQAGYLPGPEVWDYVFRHEAPLVLEPGGGTVRERIEALGVGLLEDLEAPHSDASALYDAYRRACEAARPADTCHAAAPPSPEEVLAATAAQVLEALAGKRDSVLPVDTLNRNALPMLAPDDVVEVPCAITEHLVRPLAVGPIDSASRLLIEQVKLYERSLIDAVVYRDLDSLISALSLSPLIPSPDCARALVQAFREQEAPYFDGFR
jgi:6-phospho-beta-glucosidase